MITHMQTRQRGDMYLITRRHLHLRLQLRIQDSLSNSVDQRQPDVSIQSQRYNGGTLRWNRTVASAVRLAERLACALCQICPQRTLPPWLSALSQGRILLCFK